MAVAEGRAEGLNAWLGTTLSSALLGDVTPYRQTVERGLKELGAFLDAMGVSSWRSTTLAVRCRRDTTTQLMACWRIRCHTRGARRGPKSSRGVGEP
ncbi:MAG: hypothetical protein ACREM3_20600 [Candidatus Rokuibacteriota bacterium]